jgi:hypothetical protein
MEGNENSLELVETRDAIDLVPSWEPQAWWYFAGVAAVLAIVVLVLLLKRGKTVPDPHKEKREAYNEAKTEFAKPSGTDARAEAQRVSAIIRRYLARSMGEPALFETHEEFVSRHEALKGLPDDVRESVGAFFADLAALKYAPTVPDADHTGIHTGGLELLEGIHTA